MGKLHIYTENREEKMFKLFMEKYIDKFNINENSIGVNSFDVRIVENHTILDFCVSTKLDAVNVKAMYNYKKVVVMTHLHNRSLQATYGIDELIKLSPKDLYDNFYKRIVMLNMNEKRNKMLNAFNALNTSNG